MEREPANSYGFAIFVEMKWLLLVWLNSLTYFPQTLGSLVLVSITDAVLVGRMSC